jgi:hypothetical protein
LTASIEKGTDKQAYPLIGGVHDGLDFPAPDDAESIQIPVDITGLETYIRSTLGVGDKSIAFFRHESLAPERVLERLVNHYKAWCVNRPGGRR